MNKTGMALLLTFGISSMFGVYAAEISSNDVNITVSGIKTAGENVRLNVVGADGELIWLDSTLADGEGNYKLEFKVPFEEKSKEYTVTLNGTETEKVTVEGSEDIIKKVSSISETEFDSYIKTYAERFELDVKDYESLTDTKTAYEIFKSFDASGSEDFKTAFEKTLGICKINEADRGKVFDVLEKYGDKIAPKYKSDTKNLKTSQLEKFAIELVSSDYYSMTEFESGYAAALKTAKNYASSSNSSSGGSSSSSGGKGGYVAPPTVTAPNNSVTPGTTEKTDKPFSDLAEAEWAEESILKLYEKGIINGKENGRFAPNDVVTREEFAAMLVRAFDLKAHTAAEFSDVAADAWYAEAVSAAAFNGIVNGISETEFGISRELTRQDCAAMCARMLTYLGMEASADTEMFADDAEIAEYAKTAVYTLKKLGIISGVGNNVFSPESACTRAMTAKIIDLLGEYGK